MAGSLATIGIGMPGSISPTTGLVQNANSTWLNGQHLKADLESKTGP
ncbi:MAG: ROK family protein [Hyphomicrobiaceae bacterium]